MLHILTYEGSWTCSWADIMGGREVQTPTPSWEKPQVDPLNKSLWT